MDRPPTLRDRLRNARSSRPTAPACPPSTAPGPPAAPATHVRRALALLSCSAPLPDLPLCPPIAADPRGDALLDPDAWARILVPGFDPRRDPTASPRACTGAPLDLPAPDDPARPRPRRPLGPRDLTVRLLPGGALLVWLRLDHLDDGDAFGPLAVLEPRADHRELTVMGTLRAPAGAAIRLVQSGDHSLLIAEGERCPDVGECVREARLAEVAGTSVKERSVVLPDRDGRHALHRRLALTLESARPTAPGWQERRTLERRLVDTPAGLTLNEAEELAACPILPGARCNLLLRRSSTCLLQRTDDALVCDPLPSDP